MTAERGVPNVSNANSSNAVNVGCGQPPLRPRDEFSDVVQDMADVLYDLPEQGQGERYIDYAQRLARALRANGMVVVRSVDVTYACSFLLAPPTNDTGRDIVGRTIENFRRSQGD